MRADRLPFTYLSRAQLTLWRHLCRTNGYGSEFLDVSRAARVPARWSQIRLPRLYPPELYENASARLLFQSGPGAAWADGIYPLRDAPPGRPIATIEQLDAHRPRIASRAMDAAIRMQAGQRQLVAVTLEIGAAAGERLDLPGYAKQRRPMVCSPPGASALSLLRAVQSLDGRRLLRTGRGAWILGRPTFRGPIASAAEVYPAVRECIPPIVHPAEPPRTGNLEHDEAVKSALATARAVTAYAQREELIQRARERWGTGRQGVDVRQRDSGWQEMLASYGLLKTVSQVGGGRPAGPPRWLSEPEAGRFFFRGRGPEDEHPLLLFEMPSHRAGNTSYGGGGWGWYVNANTLPM